MDVIIPPTPYPNIPSPKFSVEELFEDEPTTNPPPDVPDMKCSIPEPDFSLPQDCSLDIHSAWDNFYRYGNVFHCFPILRVHFREQYRNFSVKNYVRDMLAF